MRVDGVCRAGTLPPARLNERGRDSTRFVRSESRKAQAAANFTSELCPMRNVSLRRLVQPDDVPHDGAHAATLMPSVPAWVPEVRQTLVVVAVFAPAALNSE